MFIDKQKLEREYLDELTKLGNLFDTLDVKYCIGGGYALLAHGFKSKVLDCSIFTLKDYKEKIVEILFKLNYVLSYIDNDKIKATKYSANGDISVEIYFGEKKEKNYAFKLKGKTWTFPSNFFKVDRVEVLTYLKGKSGRGYFKPMRLEENYVLKVNTEDESHIFDLEMMNSSKKLDLDRLMNIFKLNGLI